MQLTEAKETFISEWGKLCMDWGVNRAMGQIHALLLISPQPMCSEKVMTDLEMSRGNVNMNLRALLDWGLIHKVLIKGERKEFFIAEKDFWKVFQLIIARRKKKELEPMLQLLETSSCIESKCTDSDEFCRVIKELHHFSKKADKALDILVESKTNFLTSPLLKMMR